MKGSQKVIDALNEALAEELTAINQYIVHAEEAANWGYSKLHEYLEANAITEMKHAEKLIARILFLEGAPIVSKLNKLHIGDSVEKMLNNDKQTEDTAIKMYNDIAKICIAESDQGTKELIDGILTDEEEHIDGLEERLDQVGQMGIQNYLTTIL